MQTNQYGVNAAHIPMSAPTDLRPGAFQVWGITGYTGNIDTSADISASQTAGRLAMIKQAMHGYNDFDSSRIPQPPPPDDNDDNEEDEPPRPPTPTKEDSKDHAKDHYLRYFPITPGSGAIFNYVPPPPPPSKTGKVECEECGGKYNQPVKKIKKKNGKVLCWACVWFEYMADSQQVWEDS